MGDSAERRGLNEAMDQMMPAAELPGPPFTVQPARRPTAPLVFASPHSGRDYTPAFLAAARLDPLALRRSEDSFVDELFASAPGHGAPLIAATFPRAYCDPNREAWELDPAMFDGALPPWVNTTSARVSAGLGTIARVVASGESIYRGKLQFAEAEARINRCWTPYHAELARLLAETQARHGACLLIDCHSMPGPAAARAQAPGRAAAPDFVLGDAHGTACAPRVTSLVEGVLSGLGYRVRRNDPYAGGFVTRHYGRPRDGVHALQIEISRALYMDEARIERRPEFGRVQAHLSALAARLAAEAPSLLRQT